MQVRVRVCHNVVCRCRRPRCEGNAFGTAEPCHRVEKRSPSLDHPYIDIYTYSIRWVKKYQLLTQARRAQWLASGVAAARVHCGRHKQAIDERTSGFPRPMHRLLADSAQS